MSGLLKDEGSRQRENIILTVQTPLGFFTLIVLVVEVILGLLAAKAAGTDFTIIVISMVALLFLLAIIVAILSYTRPDVLMPGAQKTQKNGARGTEYDDFLVAILPDNIINAIEHEAKHNNLDHIRIACTHTIWSCRPSRAKPILEDAIRDYSEVVREHARSLLGKFYY